jgi:hypothetical protein
MSMPENRLRTLLSHLAGSDAPPARFDLQQAISTGLRIRCAKSRPCWAAADW